MSATTNSFEFNWVETCSSKYESVWFAKNKFMWLNHMTKSHLKAKWLKAAVEKPGTRRRMLWSHFCADDTSRALGQDSSLYAHPLRVNKKLCFTQNFRYCPECLKEGFHASIFTLQAVSACPFHHIEIIAGCAICQSPFVNEERSGTVKPFCCRSCGGNIFAKTFIEPSIFAGCPKLVDAFSNATSVLKGLGQGSDIEFPLPGHSESAYAATQLMDAIWKSAYVGHNRPFWLALPPFETSSCSWIGPRPKLQSPVRSLLEQPGFYSEVRLTNAQLSEVLVDATRVIRSVDKQVSRLVHSICGHRCHDTPKIYRGRQGTQAFEFQSFSAGECPSCTILGCWRAHVGALFAIKAFIKEAGNVGWRGDKWEGWNFSELVQRNLLPVSVLSSFARMAIVISAHMNRSLPHSSAAFEVFSDRALNHQRVDSSTSNEFQIRHFDLLAAVWKIEFQSTQFSHFVGFDSARTCLTHLQKRWKRCKSVPKFEDESRIPDSFRNAKWRIPETLSVYRSSWAKLLLHDKAEARPVLL